MSPAATPVRWPAEALWEAIAPLLPGFTVEVLPRRWKVKSQNGEWKVGSDKWKMDFRYHEVKREK